jgi:hypothetical protein
MYMYKLATSSSMKMQFANTLGTQTPLGFWDPLGVYIYVYIYVYMY